MICPKCKGKTECYDSRTNDECVKRHRECACGNRFATIEILLEKKDKPLPTTFSQKKLSRKQLIHKLRKTTNQAEEDYIDRMISEIDDISG